MKIIKNFIKTHIIIGTILILGIIYLFIILGIICIRKNNLASWNAINALGQWAGILIAILIPIAAVYLEKQLERNKNEIEQKKLEIKYSNISMFDEIQQLKKELEELKVNQIHMEPISNSDIDKEICKDDIYKYICISMTATTKEIMDKFDLNFEKAKEILMELWQVDEKIRPAYIIDNPEKENCNWSKMK